MKYGVKRFPKVLFKTVYRQFYTCCTFPSWAYDEAKSRGAERVEIDGAFTPFFFSFSSEIFAR